MASKTGKLSLTLVDGQALIIGDAVITTERVSRHQTKVRINAPKTTKIARLNAEGKPLFSKGTGEAETT